MGAAPIGAGARGADFCGLLEKEAIGVASVPKNLQKYSVWRGPLKEPPLTENRPSRFFGAGPAPVTGAKIRKSEKGKGFLERRNPQNSLKRIMCPEGQGM
jgi:hypothetical protein